MKNKLQTINDNLENITGGFKYYIDSHGSHIFTLDCYREARCIYNSKSMIRKLQVTMRKKGLHVTKAEILSIILENHGFKNTHPSYNPLLKELFKQTL